MSLVDRYMADDSSSLTLRRRFRNPRHWPMWLGLTLLWLIARLPLGTQVGLGRLLGRLAAAVLPKRRHITEVNLQLCFPEHSEAERARLCREAFDNNAIGYFEAASAWFSDPERFRAITTWNGVEHLLAAHARGRGVILLGGHYSTLDLGGLLYDLLSRNPDAALPADDPRRGHPPHSVVPRAAAMQRDHDDPLFNAVMTRSRAHYCDPVLSKDDLRGLIKILREGGIVWYATDQDYGARGSVFAPFFGVPAATLTATARIAAKTGAAVVPFSHFRLPNGHYRVCFDPALTDYPSGDDVADATRTNQAIEAAIRQFPAQYLWMHRRFKTEPDGESHRRYGGK